MSEYTSLFLERLFFNLPPLVSAEVKVELQNILEELAREPRAIVEVEDIIIGFQKEIWPYTQAFEEVVQRYLDEMGESLLMRKGSYELRHAYEKYRQTGTWAGLYKGEGVHAFTVEERTELHEILVDIMCDVREFARQAALMNDRANYVKRVRYYQERYMAIEHELGRLKQLADSEENIDLAREIRQHSRDFELSIASLGPSFDFEAMCNAHAHFVGRKKELSARGMLRN